MCRLSFLDLPALLAAAFVFACTPAEDISTQNAEEGVQTPNGADAEPKRSPELKLDCVQFVAQVNFVAQPEVRQELLSIYQGPDRAQWVVSRVHEGNRTRLSRFRSGHRIWALESGQKKSVESLGDEFDRVFAQLSLRRALYLWPDGFAWTGEGAAREVSLFDAKGEKAGRLRVELEDERPVRFLSFGRDEKPFESFRDLTWQEFQGRTFVHEAVLHFGEQPIWKEKLESIHADCQFTSAYFIPPDRREGSGGESQTGTVQRIQLAQCSERRYPLPADASWQAARDLAAERLDALRKALPERSASFDYEVELTSEAKPAAVILVLRAPLAELPEGERAQWSEREAGAGIVALLPSLEALSPGKARGLQRGLGENLRPGRTALRFPAGADREVQLVLHVEGP